MRITSDLILRASLFLTLLILITPPFNNWLKLITLSLITVIIFSSKLDQKKNISNSFNFNNWNKILFSKL